jgi:hypothetical protein
MLRKPGSPIPREEETDSPFGDDDSPQSGVNYRALEDVGTCPTVPQLPAAMAFLGRVPVIARAPAECHGLPLDHRAAFLLSRIDGVSNIETILDVCAMPYDEALLILDGLIDLGVIRLT